MDIKRPAKSRIKKRLRTAVLIALGLIAVGGITLGLAKLKPPAPTLDRSTTVIATVKRGEMVREVSGNGTLVPRVTRWIPAPADGLVEKILVQAGVEAGVGEYVLHEHPVENLSLSERARIRNREVGFIFPSFNLIGDLTVYGKVELPLTYRGMSSNERKKRVTAALERVGMSHRPRHLPSQLSGGQQQRVAIARAVGGRPSILLADEPMGNLDSTNGEAVMELLRELHRDGTNICMVTHDPRYARHADRIVHMFDGRIVAEEAERVIDAG